MFGKMMNNYYYGKSGKGDFRKEDLPATRFQLFKETLRTRFSALCRLNLLYVLIWLPAMIVLLTHFSAIYDDLSNYDLVMNSTYEELTEYAQSNGNNITISRVEFEDLKNHPMDIGQYMYSSIFYLLLYLFPCIAITGPFTAGLSYVTRNWARDQHAFIWSDFRDAVKENWKQSLLISTITGLLPLAVYQGYITYGQMAEENVIMAVPQILMIVIGVIWAISVTYMHPLTVSYELKLKDVIKNGVILGIARLPFSIGIRLLHCVPILICVASIFVFGLDPMITMLITEAYYALIGFGLSRFITASYTNAVFDRFINARIEGAKVNQGLREEDDTEDDYDDETEENDHSETSEDGKE